MAVDKPPSLDLLRTFLAVYRTGTFTGTAKLLAITQPTVTNHIGTLERQLGRELFERSAAGVTPTAYAHEMTIAFGDHLDHIDRFFLDEFTDSPSMRTIHLGGPPEFTAGCLIPALTGLDTAAFPRIEMAFGLADDLISDLANGHLDLVVSTVRPREPGVTAWPIADEEFWLVGAPLIAPQSPGLDSIQQLPVVTFSRTLPLVRRYWTTVFDQQPDLRVAAVLPNLFAVKSAVVHGMGMSVLPSYLVSSEVTDGTLVRLHDPDVPPINTLYLAGRTAELNRKSRLRAVAATIVEAVKKHQAAITP
ncbi:LysR family transcriptional regulator [Nocardia sp. SSK8]|uniref:LysR family transcriptional regulator n=1 Tax=Nocardia sp. SSK8 TaxID=3120154 RepID=UPI00300A0BC3